MALALLPFVATAQVLDDQRLALIEDPLQVEFSPLPVERVRQAIGAAAGRLDWQIGNETLTRVELSRNIRGQHDLTIEISYDADLYTIRYLKSTNLLYREKDRSGAPLRAIHRSYNTWVRELAGAINAHLGAPAKVWVITLSRSGAGTGKAPNAHDAPYPEKTPITPPTADTPSEAKLFSGAWQGKWAPDLSHILVVDKVEGRRVSYIYAHGTSPTILRPNLLRGTGVVESDGRLHIRTNNGTQIYYRPAPDGQSLEGEFQATNGRVTLGSFKRRAPLE